MDKPIPNPPEIFLKPTTSYITEERSIVVRILILKMSVFPHILKKHKRVWNTLILTTFLTFLIPKGFSVNEEIELGVIIDTKVKNIPVNEAMKVVGGYCVALDMTATCKMVSKVHGP